MCAGPTSAGLGLAGWLAGQWEGGDRELGRGCRMGRLPRCPMDHQVAEFRASAGGAARRLRRRRLLRRLGESTRICVADRASVAVRLRSVQSLGGRSSLVLLVTPTACPYEAIVSPVVRPLPDSRLSQSPAAAVAVLVQS